jgi:hypothetical protein
MWWMPSRVLRTRSTGKVVHVATFDPDEMVQRFRERAAAVKKRPMPPVEGEGRRHFIEQSKLDFQDFAMLGDAEASLDEGVLTLRVDLRPPDQR